MNRIRKYNNSYQVLITPNQKFNAGFEFILGSWSDPSLMGFKVLTFDNYGDAECEASRYPDINWDQLVDFHKDNYAFLRTEIKEVISYSEMALDFMPVLLSPEQVRSKLFDRVLMHMDMENKDDEDDQNDFRLVYDMNDIINFTITNPWTENLNEFETRLINQSRLRIFKKTSKFGITHLIGRTDIGTTYEIILCPSLIYNWMKWRSLQKKTISDKIINKSLRALLKTQQTIDNSPRLR